jgi:hypothetical protein
VIVFTIAAFSVLLTGVILFGAADTWRHGQSRLALALLGLSVAAGLFSFVAIRGVVTNSDPMSWVRQPVPCGLVGC